MRKILKGKSYDTLTAKFVGVFENNYMNADFKWIREELYQKRTGEFFLYAEGGAMTKYAERLTDNEWGGGSRVIPLSYEAAKEWAEEHITAEEYESIFGQVPEDDGRKSISISIAISTHELAKRKAAMNKMSLSEYLENLVLEDISEKE